MPQFFIYRDCSFLCLDVFNVVCCRIVECGKGLIWNCTSWHLWVVLVQTSLHIYSAFSASTLCFHIQTLSDASAAGVFLKTLWQNEKFFIMSNFSFCHNVSILCNNSSIFFGDFSRFCQFVLTVVCSRFCVFFTKGYYPDH